MHSATIISAPNPRPAPDLPPCGKLSLVDNGFPHSKLPGMEPSQRMYPKGLSPEARAEFERKEEEAARKAAREMWTAGITIVASFVLVIVLVALVIIIGHIQLF